MRVIIDSHALLWFLNGDVPLGSRAAALIRDETNRPVVSVASCWELAIKSSIGKLRFPAPYEEFLWPQLRANRIDVLAIEQSHLNKIGGLAHHHRDPFDRIIVAQALVERIPVVSNDAMFDAYGVERLWA